MADDFIQPARRINQAELDAQRRKGWPDFHPEDFCHRCGGPNIVWHAPGDIWNPVMRPDGPGSAWKWNEIICPVCFVELAQELCERGVIWEVRVAPLQHAGGAELQEIAARYRDRHPEGDPVTRPNRPMYAEGPEQTTVHDLPYEEMALDVDEASNLLFERVNGRTFCQGCASAAGEAL